MKRDIYQDLERAAIDAFKATRYGRLHIMELLSDEELVQARLEQIADAELYLKEQLRRKAKNG